MFFDWLYTGTPYHPRYGHQGLLCITDYIQLYTVISRRLVKLQEKRQVLLSRKCFMQLKTFKNIRRRR